MNGGWVRLAVTFTAASTGIHTLCICGYDATGTYYADDAQLEEGEGPSAFNMVENGSMEISGYGWTLPGQTGYTAVDGGTRLQINGIYNNSADTQAYQIVQVNQPATQTYVLSGWVRAGAVPADEQTEALDMPKQCGLWAVLTYSDTSTENHYIAFNPDINEWQFVSTVIVPKEKDKTVSTIKVICSYAKNANTAYFDDISLIRELAQTMEYDDDGNLKSVTATDLDSESYNYDSNNNLIGAATSGYGSFTYTYDTTYKHRLISVKNDTVTQTMAYDGVGNMNSTKLSGADGKYIQSSSTHTTDGNRVKSVTDSTGATTTYDYGSGNTLMWNLPTTVTTANGTVTTNSYDSFGRVNKTSIANTANLSYTYEKGLLTKVTRTAVRDGSDVSQTYNLAYDEFGNLKSVKVGSRTLATYTYATPANGLLTAQTYRSGKAVSYTYDDLGRKKTATYPDGRVVTYAYTGDGQLHSVKETGGDSPATYLYEYDTLGRAINSIQFDSGGKAVLATSQKYDSSSRVSETSWQFPDSATYKNTYTYNSNGTLQGMVAGVVGTGYSYDSLLRVSRIDSEINVVDREYSYRVISGSRTSNQVASLTYPTLASDFTFSYEYDSMGYISAYTAPGEAEVTYTYDNQGQLKEARNGATTYTYTYDGAGNLLTASNGTTTHTYSYTNTNWRDILNQFDGVKFSYDSDGNPTKYYNGTSWTFSWGNARTLETATDGTVSVSYNYTADGVRTSKTVGGVTHTYYYSGTKLLRETYGTNTLDFFYDESGTPISLICNGNVYYYITNLQGDVIRLVDVNGGVAAAYSYDPYGNTVSEAGSHAAINPLRYRGYYYDIETGLYYVSSRYYDPEIGRFINADSAYDTNQGILGHNMYTYCLNNPVNMYDPDGRCSRFLWWKIDCKQASCPDSKFYVKPKAIDPIGSYNKGQGYVYVITEDQLSIMEGKEDNVVVIIDKRTASDPNMQIHDSYQITNTKQQEEIAQLMIDYNVSNPVDPAWSRTLDSLVEEWQIHNFAYGLGYKRDHTGDCDFNNADEGKGLWDFIGR